MSAPLPTTTISIFRPDNYADDAPDDQLEWSESFEDPHKGKIIVTGIRAHIGRDRGKSERDGANLPETTFMISADPCDLRKDDDVIDDTTGIRYHVAWSMPRLSTAAPMLNRTIGGLERVDGVTDGPTA